MAMHAPWSRMSSVSEGYMDGAVVGRVEPMRCAAAAAADHARAHSRQVRSATDRSCRG